MYLKPTIKEKEMKLLMHWLFKTNAPHQYSFCEKNNSILLEGWTWMTLELLCNPIIKHYEGLITLTTARQHTAKHCASSRTAVCQSLFMLFQPLGTQAEAIHLAEVSYILDKFLQFCNYILSASEAVFKSIFFLYLY